MSTIRTAPVRRTRLRLTARGRRVVAALAAAPVVTAIGLGVLNGGGALGSSDAGVPAGGFETVTVLAGDTLWGIAEEIAPDADPRDVVDAIVRLNRLDGGGVDAGAEIAIPAAYASAD
ncbi:LysM peptidoglycan-binding domain-containing protein [Microbacterium gilvum]|uniref:LysM domain-containing protein n=1 Tax=Microbacterium gilvum TaxID=1336204 RepID=A0ABP9AG67_9MICO